MRRKTYNFCTNVGIIKNVQQGVIKLNFSNSTVHDDVDKAKEDGKEMEMNTEFYTTQLIGD